ncbi:bacillithiol biosynthesis cysteine-adding enzyme BshC [Paucisalibacillus sp. EB02]|uniref:bacillithiol biosynthesis cysteine-adding enzyme BshC n=1 Tax=Paucisalibacillus sp. EB02 TaxID=1347087 RepID=UPI0004BA5E3C|nr:bacillithiol biosynthesis cysteine-adding enzyme BshC [Paucisalibacillus sp. EB02]
MRIEPIKIENQNKLVRDYRDQKLSIMNHFDYGFLEYDNRLKELKTRTYQRQELVKVLTQLNNDWGASDATLHNIERLKQEESVVVIGGQQAGVLTGPLYSVNKVISIIQLAKQQEEKLDVPVIPVFWIAGEDHDFEEINHVYVNRNHKMKKIKVGQRVLEKHSISQIALDRTNVSNFVDTIMEELRETRYTKELTDLVRNCLNESTTYVDFFARLILKLFKDEGIVLIDSGNDSVRRLESRYFLEMIQKQEDISNGVYTSLKEITEKGYSVSLDVTKDDGNLFYHKDKERILLSRNPEGNWIGKQNEVILTTDELQEIAINKPDMLSNNVVTRPLMQELVFPTLAFVGGPGEISYWSVLNSAFHALDMKMPPVVPRLSFTLVDRKTDKLLAKYNIPIESALNGEVGAIRDVWFKEKINPPIEETVSEIKSVITKVHEPLREIAKDIRSDINDLAEKNLEFLIRDVEFLEKRIINALEERFQKELTEFTTLENSLYPNGLQERIWNPIPFLNEYGINLIRDLSASTCSFEQEHFVVYM